MSRTNLFRVLFFSFGFLIWGIAPFGRTVQRVVEPSLTAYRAELLVIVASTAFMVSLGILRTVGVRGYVSRMVIGTLPLVIAWASIKLPIEWVHVIEYGAIGVLVRVGWPQNSLLGVMIMANIVSLGDEGIQGVTPDRVADLRDLWINSLSIASGLALASKSKSFA